MLRFMFPAVAAVLVSGAAPAAAASCGSLSALPLPAAEVTSAATVPAGVFSPPAAPGGNPAAATPFASLPAFCRVTATLRPTSDSDIKIPGMNHCRGGAGTDTFDVMGAIEQFVASGQAPAWIPASRIVNGTVERTRPLCAYGQVAQWNGTGSTNEAANFGCVADTTTPANSR